MTSLYYSPFTLVPKGAINARHGSKPIEGYNFKLVYKSENLYATYTLHPELGDKSKDIFLENLKSHLPYVLIDNFKEEYRLKSKDRYFLDLMSHELKTHATIPKNEYVEQDLELVSALYKKGFKRVKFKVNSDFSVDQEFYLSFLTQFKDVEFIFDFNGTASFEDLKTLNWPSDVQVRTFWEDPLLYSEAEELKELKSLGFKLILDQKNMTYHQRLQGLSEIYDVVAVKPSKESMEEVLKLFPTSKILVTTNMGDELDHVVSSHWANTLFREKPERFFGAGLYTRHFFKAIDLIDELNEKIVELKNSKTWSEDDILSDDNQGFYSRSKEIDPKVRTSFLNLKTDLYLRGWGLDKDMSRKEWVKLKDLDIEL